MLAGTGELDRFSLIWGVGALALKGYFLARQIDAKIPEQLTTYLTLLYVLFFAIDYFLLSRAFLGALVHMVLFAAMIKLFSVQRERDYVLLALLSFGMVLAATVLTANAVFFAIFCVFVLLAVMTFVTMEMRRSWISGQPVAPSEVPDSRTLARLPSSVVRACILLVVSIVAATSVLFFLIPRKPSAGYLSAFSSRSDLATGFSEEVNLGQIGQIQQSNAVVMHVQFARDEQPPADMHWRGVALTNFNGHSWSGAPGEGDIEAGGGELPMNANTTRLFSGGGRILRYRVSMEPFGTRVFFVLPEALSINGRYRMVRINSTGSIFNLDSTHPVADYLALSQLPPPMPRGLPPGGADDVSRIVYLQTPPQLDPRVRALAEQVTTSAPTPFLKAVALERYLSSTYGYTLQLPRVVPRDPIAYFLFVRKEGHCEYFASAMAIMLRTIGIPSRVVNGFHGGEYNSLTGSYIVRARNAHSWVEAYFHGYGWYTFDPTPASGADSGSSNKLALYADAMQQFWREWVMNYDSGHQSNLGIAALTHGRSSVERGRDWIESLYNSSLRAADSVRKNLQEQIAAWAAWSAVVFGLVMALLFGPRTYRMMRRMRLARHPQLEPDSAATIWYGRFLRLLAKRGIRKSPAQTAEELANSVASPEMKQRVALFNFHYERARFGNSASDAEKLPEIYREVETLRK